MNNNRYVLKRDGSTQLFDTQKVTNSINNAARAASVVIPRKIIDEVIDNVVVIKNSIGIITADSIKDTIISVLLKHNFVNVSNSYLKFYNV